MKTIDDVLLALGGERVYHQDVDLDDFILQHGELLNPDNIVLRKGVQHNCHRNTSGFYMMCHPSYRIAPGYALTGSLWVLHSWLLSKGGTVIETTQKFRPYFGVVLDDLQAAKFVTGDLCALSPSLVAFCQEVAASAELLGLQREIRRRTCPGTRRPSLGRWRSGPGRRSR